MTVHDDLVAARALIDTPEKWIKYSWDRKGCYCAAGALRHVMGMEGAEVSSFWRTPAALMLDEYAGGNIAVFNDAPDTTHADIMALFDRAIAASEVQP